MKQIELTYREYYEFKKIAELFHLKYMMGVMYGIVTIEADALSLEHLGY